MKSYIPNNINFRIVSSTSIAKFKQDQAYDFNEIIKQRDVITAPAREVILLEYDHWFKWIVKLEKVFLLLNEEDKNDTLIQKTDVLLRNEMDDILDIMSIYTDFFSSDLTAFINYVHRYSVETLKVAITITLKDNDIFSAFSKIVYFISVYLQQVLLALQEIELILHNKKEKIYKLHYSGFCKDTCHLSGICPIAERSKYYKDNFGKKVFVLHNHTREQMTCDCLERVKKYDIEIDHVVNEFDNVVVEETN